MTGIARQERYAVPAGLLGAGVEFAIAAPWTAKLEYLYVDLGDFDCGQGLRRRPGPDNVDSKRIIVRAGLNYRF